MDLYGIFVKKYSYPLYMKYKGSNVFSNLESVEKSQYYSLDEIRKIQWDKLLKIINYAYEHTKYYRLLFDQEGLHPSGIKSYEDFINIPVLSKSNIQNNVEYMISDTFSKNELYSDRTGGSTGTPLTFYYDKRKQEFRDALRIRNDRWSSWDIGEKVATIWGERNIRKMDMKSQALTLILRKGLYLNSYSLTENKMSQFARLLMEYRPNIIMAYAGALSLLAKHLLRMNMNDVKIRAAITSAEALSDEHRQLIETVFSCNVFERYGCREVGPIASECREHSGLHVNSEGVFVEILDSAGHSVKDGELGNVVITDLQNYAMPFIRYKIQDMARAMEEQCSCGLGLPKIGKVEGRVTDYIKTYDGRIVAGPMAIPLICEIPGLQQAQIIQEKEDMLIINIVKNTEFNEQSLKELRRRAANIFGERMIININHKSAIPQEKSGKYRFCISKITKK